VSRPSRSLPPGKTWYPLYRRLGGPQGRSGQVQKISPPPGFDPRAVQSVARCYTDYATGPTHTHTQPHTLMHLFYVDQVMCRCSECKFYILAMLLHEIKVFQDVTLCHLASSFGHFQGHDAFISRDLSSIRRLGPTEVEAAKIL